MKSLTPWCNLYCSALRFNIKVSPSAIKAILKFIIVFGCGYILLLFTIGFKLWFTIALVVIVFFLVSFRKSVFLLSQAYSSTCLNKTSFSQCDFFLLTDIGQCQFSHEQKQQLSSSSQINLWGYWLVFTDSQIKSRFIFKDSLSEKDQARMVRTIMRVQQLG